MNNKQVFQNLRLHVEKTDNEEDRGNKGARNGGKHQSKAAPVAQAKA